MGQVTKQTALIELLSKLESLDDNATIYAAEPWTCDSQAIVDVEPTTGGLPVRARERGLVYFAEVFVVRDFLSDWAAGLKKPPSDRERCERLIRYAVDDA